MNEWVYYIPPVSWMNRIYHLIVRDEPKKLAIDRNYKAIIGNYILVAILLAINALLLATM